MSKYRDEMGVDTAHYVTAPPSITYAKAALKVSSEEDDFSLSLEPHELLWVAVLEQTLEDATAPETSLAPGADKATRSAHSAVEVARRQARAFIFSHSATSRSHFADLCDTLSLDPDYVKERCAHWIRHGISFKRNGE